jgi:hypothetical protein
MHYDLRAEKPRAIPRVLERQNDGTALHQAPLPFMPTERMQKAALLNGWPMKGYHGQETRTHAHEKQAARQEGQEVLA